MSDTNAAINGDLVEALTWREQDILALLAERRTNREIAQALSLELTTVKWYNKQIYSKLGVDNRYQAVAKAHDYGLLGQPSAPPDTESLAPESTLPAQLTSFVGRGREIAEIKRLLGEAHLLTLTGPAGTGKTRLALHVAAQVVGDFDDGVFFVDLAPIGQPERVGDTIAQALGVVTVAGQPTLEVLKNYLRKKTALLIVDNFEHVLEAAPLIGDLLSASPALKMVITSREALKVYGEQEYPVPPLELPDLSRPDSLSALTDCEAVTLFSQRARAVKPDITLAAEDARAVAEICVRLDGLPLAIELAAARVRLFSPQVLQGQLESRLSLRGDLHGLPSRHQTLRGAIEWSYELLDDAEKTLFARMSVFQGGRTIDAVQDVCCHGLSIDALDGLESLLNKNLLRHEDGPEGEPRFVMLETIHEYGRERLQQSGEAEDVRRRHAEFFTALVERAEPHTRGGRDQIRWLRRLEADHDNLRAAYAWSMKTGDVELALRLVGALGFFWFRLGHFAEGQRWTARARDVIATRDVPPAIQANVYFAAGVVSLYLGDREQGKEMFEASLARYEERDARREIGWAFILLGFLSVGLPDEYEQAVAQCEEGLARLRSLDDKAGVAQGLNNLGELKRLQGNLLQAREAYAEGLAIAREIGDGLRESLLIMCLGQTAHREGDMEEALALLQEGLTVALEIGNRVGAANILPELAGVALELGQAERAARLFGAAEASYEKYGFSPLFYELPEFHRFWARVRDHLDEATFQAMWEEGRAMSLEEAIAYALEEPASGE